MDHRVGHFYAGGKSVEEQASGFLFEDADEFAIGGEVIFVAEDGGGECRGCARRADSHARNRN